MTAPTESLYDTTPEGAARPDSLIELAGRLATVGPAVGGWEELRTWARALELVAHRRALRTDAPILTILFGPTGAGKSTLFNGIVGRTVSPAGAIRPCTTRPIGVAAPHVVEFFRADEILARSPLAIDWHPAREAESWLGHQALVDTPDFDGVEVANRHTANVLAERAERAILVVSPDKYADASVWDQIEALLPLGKLTATIFNKDEGSAALGDFRELLAQRGLPPPHAVGRLPIGSTRAPACDADGTPLRTMLALPQNPRTVFDSLRRALETSERTLRKTAIEPWIVAQSAARTRSLTELTRLRDELPARLGRRMPLELDAAMRAELQRRFVKMIQRYDLLREPRRWLMAPFQWLRAQVGGGGSTAGAAPGSSDWLTDANRGRFHELRLELAEELRFVGRPLLDLDAPALPWPEFEAPDPELTRRELRAIFEGLQQQVERESERIAQGLSAAGKLSFYGSQLVFHSLMVGVFIKTGGLLSVGELAAQGLLSPFVAKIAEHLVSTGEAAEVEKRLAQYFAERLAVVLGEAFSPYREHLARLAACLPDRTGWDQATAAWDRSAS
ncbi:MAG: hypothetical protein AB7O52_01640 [Planctomycetota bacterium]